ncbi:MAG TPA: hypothetical protein VGN32_17330, partial [Ktedonobacterales bacterium]|nr:hypothetical protein [Ktedonobacterales bacterium]
MPHEAPDWRPGALISAPLPLPEAVLVLALQVLIGCVLGALVFWGLARWVRRRRLGRRPANQRTLFVAFLLLAVGGSNLYIEGRAFLPRSALYAIPVQVLFLLFFYVFSEERYTPRWARWLGVFYTFSLLATVVNGPTTSTNQTTNPQGAAVLNVMQATPGVLGLLAALGNMLSLMLVVVGIVPQVYLRYRQLSTAVERPWAGRYRWSVVLGALLVGSFLVLLVSGLFALTSGSDQFAHIGAVVSASPPNSAVLYAQVGFYLLTALVPIAAAFAVLRERGYDRDALANRTLVAGAVGLVELLIYVAGVATAYALRSLAPSLSAIAPYASIPFFVLIALLMAAAFRPLRARLQDRIDQLLDLRRYQAARTIAAWRPTLREELHLDHLCARLVEITQKALEPDRAALWLRTAPTMPASHLASLASSPP